MRKIILIGLLFLTACNKKTITCTAPIYNVPGNIGFSGFNVGDVDTLIISSYSANDSFTHFISSDTVINPHVSEQAGYLFADSTMAPFANISQSADLEIYLPSVAKTFHVHAVYSSQTIESWPGPDGECSMAGPFIAGPVALIVNGNSIPDTSSNPYYFFLHS